MQWWWWALRKALVLHQNLCLSYGVMDAHNQTGVLELLSVVPMGSWNAHTPLELFHPFVSVWLGVQARTSRLFSLFFGILDKKLKVLDYAIKTT